MAEHRHRWEIDSLDDAHKMPDRSECDCDFYAWVDSLEGQTVAYVMTDGSKIPVVMGGRFKPDEDVPTLDMQVDEDTRVIGA